MKLVIDIPEDVYKKTVFYREFRNLNDCVTTIKALENDIPLPKGHGDLFDKTEILRFLKCPKYERCDWKNCFDCNESRCINLNNVNELVPIIEADKESEDKCK